MVGGFVGEVDVETAWLAEWIVGKWVGGFGDVGISGGVFGPAVAAEVSDRVGRAVLAYPVSELADEVVGSGVVAILIKVDFDLPQSPMQQLKSMSVRRILSALEGNDIPNALDELGVSGLQVRE